MAPQEDRLSRIETKLDKLADAVVQLARMEERMVTLFRRMDNYEGRQDKLEEKTELIDNVVRENTARVKFAERVFWIATTAGISFLMYMMR